MDKKVTIGFELTDFFTGSDLSGAKRLQKRKMRETMHQTLTNLCLAHGIINAYIDFPQDKSSPTVIYIELEGEDSPLFEANVAPTFITVIKNALAK